METISKNKLLFTTIILLVLINVSTLSLMWYWKINEPHPPVFEPRGYGPPPEGREFLKEQLKLTDSQMETVDKIRDEHLMKIKKIREGMKDLKDKLFSNLSNPDADTNMLKEITNQIGTLEAKIDLITYNNFREVRKICTDEQKKKFDEIILDLMRMNAPRPPGMRPPPPRPDGSIPRSGNGRINPPGIPEKDGKPPPPEGR